MSACINKAGYHSHPLVLSGFPIANILARTVDVKQARCAMRLLRSRCWSGKIRLSILVADRLLTLAHVQGCGRILRAGQAGDVEKIEAGHLVAFCLFLLDMVQVNVSLLGVAACLIHHAHLKAGLGIEIIGAV